ncbi:hypothetical protein [Sphingomonas anseongensis]|jgi:hypothetical protein|nr:hypothetical protein [Sphingomonas anseongensis]
MSIASFSLAEPAVAETAQSKSGNQPPKSRVTVAKADRRSAPELR